jgi:hypothetical protein
VNDAWSHRAKKGVPMRQEHDDPAWQALEERTVASMERQFTRGRVRRSSAAATSQRAARWALALFAVGAVLLVALLTAPFPFDMAGLAPIAAAVFLLRHDF